MQLSDRRKPTVSEVRTHYADQGYQVRIDDYGYVTYRIPGEKIWREGRWVGEYTMDRWGDIQLT